MRQHNAFAGFARHIEPEEWLRMATFLDTEGSIQIKTVGVSTPCRIRQRLKSPNHQLQVSVTNTDPRIPLWCKNAFGGSVTLTSPPKAHHRRIYRWGAGTLRAEAVLRGCLPYFLIKRDQAEVALAYRETMTSWKYGRLGLPDALVQERETLKLELERLKRVQFDASKEHAEVLSQLDPQSKSKGEN